MIGLAIERLCGQKNDSQLAIQLTPLSDGGRAEENKWIGFVLNFVIGFGVGSFVQGDMLGGC